MTGSVLRVAVLLIATRAVLMKRELYDMRTNHGLMGYVQHRSG